MVEDTLPLEPPLSRSARARSVLRRAALVLSALVLLALCLLLPDAAPAADADPATAPLQVTTTEPRAFGHHAGDVLERRIVIEIPARLTLNEDSLPIVGPQSPVLELRSLQRTVHRTAGGQQLILLLRYQVFAAPVSVRSYELPRLLLRFDGVPRAEELRIETWPVVVSALATEVASPREGLGELRPDTAPPLRSTAIERTVLWSAAALATLALVYLALVYLGLPWWGRRHRPFGQAFKLVRQFRPTPDQSSADGAPDVLDACRALHAAFNQTAGRTLFAESIEAFVVQAPRFAGLRRDIQTFFTRSQAVFFGAAPAVEPPQHDWLLAFARACRDAERGTPARPVEP